MASRKAKEGGGKGKKSAAKSQKKPQRKPPAHGTRSRYTKGCRCPRCTKANRDYHAEKRAKADKLAEKAPKGDKLNSAEMSVRDTLIVTRRAQGWSFEAIAKEVKLTPKATREAYERKRASMTSLLELDAKKILEWLIEGLQFSIGDLEQLAVAAVEERNMPAAVSAKKAANEAREKLQDLLQTTGILPHDLGTFRHQFEFQVVVVEVVNLVHTFVAEIEGLDLPKDKRPKIMGAAEKLKTGLEQLDTNGGSDARSEGKAIAATAAGRGGDSSD